MFLLSTGWNVPQFSCFCSGVGVLPIFTSRLCLGSRCFIVLNSKPSSQYLLKIHCSICLQNIFTAELLTVGTLSWKEGVERVSGSSPQIPVTSLRYWYAILTQFADGLPFKGQERQGWEGAPTMWLCWVKTFGPTPHQCSVSKPSKLIASPVAL